MKRLTIIVPNFMLMVIGIAFFIRALTGNSSSLGWQLGIFMFQVGFCLVASLILALYQTSRGDKNKDAFKDKNKRQFTIFFTLPLLINFVCVLITMAFSK